MNPANAATMIVNPLSQPLSQTIASRTPIHPMAWPNARVKDTKDTVRRARFVSFVALSGDLAGLLAAVSSAGQTVREIMQIVAM